MIKVKSPSFLHTFDWRGPQPAHRHINPDGSEGGIVEDTATVDEKSILSPTSVICNAAVMHGGVMHGGEMHGGVMHGGVMWGGVMRGGEMHGGDWQESPPQAQIGRYPAIFTRDKEGNALCGIGCQVHLIDKFRDDLDAIANQHGATVYEAALSAQWIENCAMFDAAGIGLTAEQFEARSKG